MKVPDSLRLTDPFRYQWYVALKDSLTHRIVVDSLMAEGDSLLWPRIDSIYLADSAATAKAAFEKMVRGPFQERKEALRLRALQAARHPASARLHPAAERQSQANPRQHY